MSALEVRNLSVEVAGRRLVDTVSFSIEPGEFVALVGPNGAGKTTCLRAILGFVPARVERIAVAGRPFAGLNPVQRGRAVAYLPQDRHVAWPLSVAATVALGRYPHMQRGDQEMRRKVEAALDCVGMKAFARRDVRTLSGGELALVLLARALAVEAPVLLADEPVASLDPAHQVAVMERLSAQARAGDAVVVVLHDLSLAARYCDRLLLMAGGCIMAGGSPAEILRGDTLQAAYGVPFLCGELGGRPVVQAVAR